MNQARSGIHAKFSPTFRKRFRFTKVIGQGGSAVVYLATQLDLKRPVAIKVLDAVGFAEGDAEGRFADEAKLASRLDHPNLCRLFEFGRDGDCAYLVYEFVEGEDLARRLSRQKKEGRAGLDLDEALPILGDVARGLEYAHKLGVVHRDLKPANILLSSDGVAKVTDFGLAKMSGLTRVIQTETGMVVGTPECMAPEQAMGKEVGPEADVYALGCLFFWILAGRPPFQDESAGKVMVSHIKEKFPALDRVRPNLGSGVYTLLDEMVRRRPEGRPTPTEILRAIKVLNAPVRARSVDVSQALSRQRMKIVRQEKKRNPWMIAGLTSLALLCLGVAWWFWPRQLPRDVEVLLAPSRARIRWKGPSLPVEIRPADGSGGWRSVEGIQSLGHMEVEVTDLEPDQQYHWRFQGEDEGGRAPIRTLAPAVLGESWPRYDAQGNPVGWLLRIPEHVVIILPGGGKAVVRGDGLTEVGEEGFSLGYRGGLSEPAPAIGVVPPLMKGIDELIQDVAGMRVRKVLGAAARASGKGEIPTLAARRSASGVYSRWKGLEPALRTVIPRLGSQQRLNLYLALDFLQSVDRALRNEGLPPVFDSIEHQRRCLQLSCSLRSFKTSSRENQTILVTERQYRSGGRYRDFLPPREPIPDGEGDLLVRLDVEDLWADRYLSLELVPEPGAGQDSSPLHVSIRPPCLKFRFEGSIQVTLPGDVVRGRTHLKIHVRLEDLPNLAGTGGKLRFPLFGSGTGESHVLGGEVRLLEIRLQRLEGR